MHAFRLFAPLLALSLAAVSSPAAAQAPGGPPPKVTVSKPVVKEIVERHNGWVQVEGRKGEGACFTIHIPLYQGDEQQRGQKSQKSRGKSRKDQK